MDGSGFNGTIYKTTVGIGSTSVTQMAVLFVTSYNDSSLSPGQISNYDGLCGLSPAVLSTNA